MGHDLGEFGLREAVRPGPFMELMTDKAFFPPLAAWGMMPKIAFRVIFKIPPCETTR